MKLNFIFNFMAAPAICLCVAAPALAVELTDVRGTVVDSTGATVSGATVRLPGDEQVATTDGEGRFTLKGVPPGTRLAVSSPGFATVEVPARGSRAMRIVLVPAGRSEEVTVRGAGVVVDRITSATRTPTLLRDVPQSITVVTRASIGDQAMHGMADAIRYLPGVGLAQGEGNRDQPIFRGNSSTSDFFADGIRDDVQYIRDLYNVERVEALKGANAMTFGRGGVGGVINRVSRQADWSAPHELAAQAGAWGERRVTADLGQPFGAAAAGRITALYENSDSYRAGAGLERYGVNPTLAFRLGAGTTLRAGYERFHDGRTADRGVPSFEGLPLATDPGLFFGDAERSRATITVDAASLLLEHDAGHGITLRNQSRYAVYDKFYRNVFPGAVNPAGTTVSLSAYDNATGRRNLYNQTDVVVSTRTGAVAHTLLAGGELGRQVTDNLRHTGYFTTLGPNVTTVNAPIEAPTTSLPLDFRPNATDADNHGVATTAALYVQDQAALSRHLQVIAGLRYDRFTVDFQNHRTATDLSSTDGVFSPRVGVIVKPVDAASLYASYTRSFLPRAGEQLSSLSATNQALEPEDFRNYEVGAKWDIRPALAVTAAVYRLDRGNVAVPDPTDPAVSHLVDGQRTQGVELGATGAVTNHWTVVAGYAYQDAEITTSLSPVALAGARLAQVPAHSFSLWNKYDLNRTWGVGLGLVHRGEVFTSTDNTVVLPASTRVDAALFAAFRRFRGQVNVENALDSGYFAYANGNNNITPGSPRAVRIGLTTRF